MTANDQEKFIRQLYSDIFTDAKLELIPEYFAKDYIQQTDYDQLDYKAFVEHVKEISTRDVTAKFHLEFLVNNPGVVVVRCRVNNAAKIDGSTPIALLISLWQFDDDGLLNRCIEVQSSS